MLHKAPWQLKMFQKTLKKKLRLKALRRHLGALPSDDFCLLVTCGDNNGAMNYHLREIGGKWSWAELETKSIKEMSELLGEQVFLVNQDHLPFPENTFDHVVSIDVHEHLIDPNRFTAQLWRVIKKNGRLIVTVPNGDKRKMVIKIRNLIGMTKEKYGHVREGFTLSELRKLLEDNHFEPCAETSFSKFFTELLELSINFLYTNFFGKNTGEAEEAGSIVPATQEQLKSVEKTYKIYSLIYPLFWLISRMDILCFGTTGYVVMVEGRKE